MSCKFDLKLSLLLLHGDKGQKHAHVLFGDEAVLVTVKPRFYLTQNEVLTLESNISPEH